MIDLKVILAPHFFNRFSNTRNTYGTLVNTMMFYSVGNNCNKTMDDDRSSTCWFGVVHGSQGRKVCKETCCSCVACCCSCVACSYPCVACSCTCVACSCSCVECSCTCEPCSCYCVACSCYCVACSCSCVACSTAIKEAAFTCYFTKLTVHDYLVSLLLLLIFPILVRLALCERESTS